MDWITNPGNSGHDAVVYRSLSYLTSSFKLDCLIYQASAGETREGKCLFGAEQIHYAGFDKCWIFFFINTFPHDSCFVFHPGTYWNTADSLQCKQEKTLQPF